MNTGILRILKKAMEATDIETKNSLIEAAMFVLEEDAIETFTFSKAPIETFKPVIMNCSQDSMPLKTSWEQ